MSKRHNKADDKPDEVPVTDPVADGLAAYDAAVPAPEGEEESADVREERYALEAEMSRGEPKSPKKPAVIHSAPHLAGAPHAPGAEGDSEQAQASADNSHFLAGLRKDGRLFRCTHAGLLQVLVEADDEKSAKEAAVTEFERLAGEMKEEEKVTVKVAGVKVVKLLP